MKSKAQHNYTMDPFTSLVCWMIFYLALIWNAINWTGMNVVFTMMLSGFGVVFIMLKIVEKTMDIFEKWRTRSKKKNDSIH